MKLVITVVVCLAVVLIAALIILMPASECILIDSFEGEIKGGIEPTVDYGSGAGAKIEISGAKNPINHSKQSMRIVYDVSGGGYMWAARGYGLTAPTAAQWRKHPSKINWDRYDAITFYLYGEESGNDIAVDIIDGNKQYWRCLIKDDVSGWKKVILPFASFRARTDWQPSDAVRGENIKFPVNAFQFEPKTGKGTIYIDTVCLRKKVKE